ncbi:MAG: hypothetical protein NTZ05_11690, partial [Chloroflexi bacterium]|nr:hypothetical protein [Chloroflexota bacterium]
ALEGKPAKRTVKKAARKAPAKKAAGKKPVDRNLTTRTVKKAASKAKDAAPDYAGAVSALLAAGAAPHDIELEIAHELVRQTAPYWRRHDGGAWYEVYVCAWCGRRRMACVAAHCVVGWLLPRRTEYDVTLRAWEQQTVSARRRRRRTWEKVRPRRRQRAGMQKVHRTLTPTAEGKVELVNGTYKLNSEENLPSWGSR